MIVDNTTYSTDIFLSLLRNLNIVLGTENYIEDAIMLRK